VLVTGRRAQRGITGDLTHKDCTDLPEKNTKLIRTLVAGLIQSLWVYGLSCPPPQPLPEGEEFPDRHC